MADCELREAIVAASEAEPAYHSHVQLMTNIWQRRSKEDIERSWRVCAAELEPRMIMPEGLVWHGPNPVFYGDYERKKAADLLAAIREIARGG